jgi:hypothetical protein
MRRISAAAVAVTLALIAAPASSLGAVVKHEDGVGLVYRASRGEANDLRMNPFAGGYENYATSIGDLGAPLKQRGSFCGVVSSLLLCPADAVYAYLRDGDDRGSAFTYYRDAFIWGQGGNDVVRANGRSRVAAYGGPGDDSVFAGADGIAEAWGQAGNDIVGAGSQNYARLYGGAGDDVLQTGPSGNASIADGGPGNDRIDGRNAPYLTVLGRAGADTITVDHVRAIDGGSNNDTITGHASRPIDGNRGNDRIDVSGNPGGVYDYGDTVTCGPGADTVIADPNDSIATDCEKVTRIPLSGPAPSGCTAAALVECRLPRQSSRGTGYASER